MTSKSSLSKTSFVIYAKDMEVVAGFYKETLGLSTVETKPKHVLLGRAGIEVIVIQSREASVGPAPLPGRTELRATTPLKASFLVADLDYVRQAAERTGGTLKPREAGWRWRGMIHLDGSDPEGNIVQFRALSAAS